MENQETWVNISLHKKRRPFIFLFYLKCITEATFDSWQIQFGLCCLMLVGQRRRKGNNYNFKTQNVILRSVFKERGRMKQNEEDESESVIGMHQSKGKSPLSFGYKGYFEVVWS